MKAAAFYAIGTIASLGAIAAESAYARRKRNGWYDAADTITNLNIGAGNVLTGLVLAAFVAAGYGWLYAHRVLEASARLPAWASFALAVLFADFLQYWNHRLSHDVNVLWAGHITHHSSPHLNLSTGIRINWLYRGYAWLLYAPMPLLGFSFESFVAAQAVIGTYNLFMHTRLRLPFGPLRRVLVTAESHGLHHSSDPRYFGNYGAALIVWDRLFGTYRELPAGVTLDDHPFGIGRAVGENPLRLNVHYLVELWRTAREESRSFVSLLLSPPAAGPALGGRHAAAREASVPFWMWLGLGIVAVATLAIQAAGMGAGPDDRAHVARIFGGIALITFLGVALERRVRNHR